MDNRAPSLKESQKLQSIARKLAKKAFKAKRRTSKKINKRLATI